MRQIICVIFIMLFLATSSRGNDVPAAAHYLSDPEQGFELKLIDLSIRAIYDSEVEADGYWFDSWTDESSYVWGDTIDVYSIVILSGQESERLERWDGFYLCGESNPAEYLHSGYIDFGTVQPGVYETCISYDTDEVQVKALLQEFVKTGTREEAVAATRALCGYKVITLGEVDDEKERKRIARTCDLAAGRVFYWIKRPEASKPSKL